MKQKRFILKKKVVTFSGRVLNIKYEVVDHSFIVHGVKRTDEKNYQPPVWHGGFGTFSGYHEVERHLLLRTDIHGYGRQTVDIRQEALDINGREKVTDNFVDKLRTKLVSRELRFRKEGGGFKVFDDNDLKV